MCFLVGLLLLTMKWTIVYIHTEEAAPFILGGRPLLRRVYTGGSTEVIYLLLCSSLCLRLWWQTIHAWRLWVNEQFLPSLQYPFRQKRHCTSLLTTFIAAVCPPARRLEFQPWKWALHSCFLTNSQADSKLNSKNWGLVPSTTVLLSLYSFSSSSLSICSVPS